jgi:outer membrane receptor protein involved in Fe transport
MKTNNRIAIFGALALALAGQGWPNPHLYAQAPVEVALTVEDESGAALAEAKIADSAGNTLGTSNGNGEVTIHCAEPCELTVSARGFAPQQVSGATGAQVVRLKPANASERVTVTAYGAPLGTLESPASTRELSQRALNQTAAVTLDGKLRQLPGVELFRRSSSLVANPTSQGISMRGLGSTSASRTLVIEDEVPLNDPIGGWIHWQEVPELAIRDVEIVRGGASDLYGSSAIGGVISILPVRPASNGVELRGSYGGEGTFDDSLLAEIKRGPWGVLASGGLIGTDGYIEVAPAQRGPIDQPSNVHSQNGLFLAEHDRGPWRVFTRASGFDDSRHNGTPYQMNATRLIRYATGADWQNAEGAAITLRLYGSTELYRQTFSQILNTPATGDAGCAYRCAESPTKLTHTSDNELGGALKGSRSFGSGLLLIGGTEVHDVRVWDREQSYTGTGALTNLHDHQRDPAVWAELMWVRNAWTLAASGRMDWFQNYDGHQVQWNGTGWIASATQPPQNGERLFDPRAGVSRRIFARWAVSASGFRAFRAPTPSELYRATQVGNELTKPNGNLLSERATGWETGVATTQSWGRARVSYFLTQVNRPITAFTVNPNSNPILLMRENLGQIESRGVSADFELEPRSWLAVDGGYQYAHAVVSGGTQDYGNWIPEVARNMATLNVRAFKSSLGVLSLQARYSGRMFDDDANLFPLSGFFRLDAYASHPFGRLELFAAGENLTNAQIQVSKTPQTTLGQPIVGRIGFMFRLGDAAR